MMDVAAILGSMSQRVNVMTRCLKNGKLVIIYDDHRWLLNVLFKIQKELLGCPPKLVFFDSHDDAATTENKTALLDLIGVGNLFDATEKQFGAFVDYDVRSDDGNWLSVACELNLISDGVVIGNKYCDNIKRMVNGIYSSEDGIQHKLYELSSNLEHELGCRGSLGDHAKEKEYNEIRAFFNSTYGHNYAQIGTMSPFVLDFDLDFYTLDTDEGTMAWPLWVWEKKFHANSPGLGFMQELINQAIVITICREPDFCGNIAGSNYNLRNLDYYFFGGQLGTNLLL